MIGKDKIKFIQEQLNARNLNAGPADGIAGKKTYAALAKVDAIPADWIKKRKLIGFIQLLCKENGIDSGKKDGYWGPQTEYAYELLQEKLETGRTPAPWRPEQLSQANPNAWPIQTPQKEIINFYGEPGRHQTYLHVPYPHKLAWDTSTTIKRFQCHEKVHDSLLRVLKRVNSHYGQQEIERLRLDLFGGCFNKRKMRGGTRWSMHSWGIALDYDPSHNKLKWGRDKAGFAHTDYDTWWRLWEEEGWVSLGRTRNFDWMHVQAAKL